jgi:hypothetical protein
MQGGAEGEERGGGAIEFKTMSLQGTACSSHLSETYKIGEILLSPLVLIAFLHYWGPCTESLPGFSPVKLFVFKPLRASGIF